MDHPDESMLLASTRQQPDGWPGGVKQHITQCLTCHARYNEYRRINALLREGTRAPVGYIYPSITDSVIQRVHELESSSNHLTRGVKTARQRYKGYRGATRPIWQLVGSSLAAIAVILSTLMVFALATAYVHLPANFVGHFTEFKPTTVAGPYKGRPVPTYTIVATATQQPTSGGMSSREPSITVCSSSADVKQNRLRICGHNFKPGSRVALIIKMQGSRPRALKPVLVQADGTMQDWFPIHGCGTLPSAIVAQYANSNAVLTTLGNIQFAGCNGEPHAVHQALHSRDQK